MGLEVRVDNYVRRELDRLEIPFYNQNDLPVNYKNALKGLSKTGSGNGTPDFAIGVMPGKKVGVIIENKWGLDKHEKLDADGKVSSIKKDISDYAVNGAVHYAKGMVETHEFDEVYAIGISGEGGIDDVVVNYGCYLVREGHEPKFINILSLSKFRKDEFTKFHKENKLTDEEKHLQLDKQKKALQTSSKQLNKLMNDNAITVDLRVIFVSGMMLAMKRELTPDKLEGRDPVSTDSDGKIIYNYIDNFLRERRIEPSKREMMMSNFNQIKADMDRDRVRVRRSKKVGRNKDQLSKECSVNKEIFEFIYYNVFQLIQNNSHLDTLGEMYSEFLKYALGDGKENGIVLTPHYTTQLMTRLIGIDKDSRVLDLCTGSGGFLVTAMTEMINDAKQKDDNSQNLDEKIKNIKANQILGVELDSKMFTLAATNMILRGDGSSSLIKGSAFDVVKEREVIDFEANKALLNPPFSYNENGMPFALEALNVMKKDGELAIIIQDSAGTGRATKTNQRILENHTLKASIRMPADLFQPNAGVQTSIYIIKVGTPHDTKSLVKFIDFSDDGYKRTGRGITSTGEPERLYQDILGVYKYGERYENYNEEEIDYIEAEITLKGDDWNYTQHRVIDTTPTEEDFIETVGQYLEFEISQILQGRINYEDEVSYKL